MLFSITDYLPLSTLLIYCLLAYTTYYIGWIVYSRFLHPYHGIPGPFLASISSWWRWYAVRYAVEDSLQHRLHDTYGPIVRISPNEISVADPQTIDLLSRPEFLKTDFYNSFNPKIGGRVEPFAEQDAQIHLQHKRIITPLFRSEAVLEYESYVDRILGVFDERMTSFAQHKSTFDLAEYVERFTWDTVGDLVYSRKGGFGMLKGDDYMGWMKMIHVMPGPVASMYYVPYGLQIWYTLSMLAFSPSTRRGIMSAMTVRKQVQELVKKRKDQESAGEDFPTNDMLSKMMAMTRDDKVDFNEDDIAVILNAFVWAGSDTTGSSLAVILYSILTNPRVLSRLLSELKSAFTSPSHPNNIPYSSLSKLPYLTACINEGLRLHFIIGIGIPRTIPAQGATICNHHFPGGRGLKVTANIPVMQSDPQIFGDDARKFRPERWTEGIEKDQIRMHTYFRPWGIGTRICQGRFIAMMQIYKFLASTLLQWDFQVDNNDAKTGGGGTMRVNRGYIQQPSGMMVRVGKREEKELD